jgi:putative endonuclease
MNEYFVYITTNKSKKVLYTGVTNNLLRRLSEHYEDSKERKESFAGKYNCYNLIYFEKYFSIIHAINREKEIKLLKRNKKEELINDLNPTWEFLNTDF